MTSREKQAKETKSKVLASAKKMIELYGYDNVRIDDIVKDCNVAKGTFYHYFKTKEEVVHELIGSVYDELQNKLQLYTDCPFTERLCRLIQDWYGIVNKYNLHLAKIAEQLNNSLRTEKEDGSNISHMDEGLLLMKEFLQAAVQNGELREDTPVDILAMTVSFEIQGSAIYNCNHNTDFDVMGWCDSFIHTVLIPIFTPFIVEQRK